MGCNPSASHRRPRRRAGSGRVGFDAQVADRDDGIEGDTAGGEGFAGSGEPVDDGDDAFDDEAELDRPVDRQERGSPGGGHVLDDHHLLTGDDRPLDVTLRAMVLRLLADHESAQVEPGDPGHRDDGAGHRIGTDRHPPDGGREGPVPAEDFEDRSADEHRAAGVEDHLLGVEVEARLPTGGEAKRPAAEGLGGDEGDQFGNDL